VSVVVTTRNQATGDESQELIGDGDYLVTCTEPAQVSVQVYANGTHVITVKGRLERCRDGYHTMPHKGCILR
jgi:hypothetical protein